MLLDTICSASLLFSCDSAVALPNATVYIDAPAVRYEERSLYLSKTSDRDAVCRAFGFPGSSHGAYVLDFGRELERPGPYTAAIGSRGTVVDLLPGTYDDLMKGIHCDASDRLPVRASAEHAGIVENGDGSFTVNEPRYKGDRLDSRASLDGACRWFGYAQSAGAARLGKASAATLAQLADDGRVASYIGLDESAEPLPGTWDYHYPVRWLLCR